MNAYEFVSTDFNDDGTYKFYNTKKGGQTKWMNSSKGMNSRNGMRHSNWFSQLMQNKESPGGSRSGSQAHIRGDEKGSTFYAGAD